MTTNKRKFDSDEIEEIHSDTVDMGEDDACYEAMDTDECADEHSPPWGRGRHQHGENQADHGGMSVPYGFFGFTQQVEAQLPEDGGGYGEAHHSDRGHAVLGKTEKDRRQCGEYGMIIFFGYVAAVMVKRRMGNRESFLAKH